MDRQRNPKTLDASSFVVKREAFSKNNAKIPVVDLSGKGIFDSVSSNRSKQNDQRS